MTRKSHVTLLSRIRRRMRAFLVLDASPRDEALDNALRQSEQRVSTRFTLLLLLAASAVLWAAIIHIVRAVL